MRPINQLRAMYVLLGMMLITSLAAVVVCAVNGVGSWVVPVIFSALCVVGILLAFWHGYLQHKYRDDPEIAEMLRRERDETR